MLEWLWNEVGPGTISGILSGVAVALLVRDAPKFRALMKETWVGGVATGTVVVLVLSGLLRGPEGPPGPTTLDEGFVVAFAGEQCPNGWEPYQEAAGKFILGAGEGVLRFRGPHRPDGADTQVNLTAVELGDQGGAEEVLLEPAHVAAHRHLLTGNSYLIVGGGTPILQSETETPSYRVEAHPGERISTANSNNASAHDNMPPYIALYFCTPET